MVGRTLSAVTLSENKALTNNYLQLDLTDAHPANQIADFRIGGLTQSGLREYQPFPVLQG
jgi:hypothetical protein